MALSMPCIQLAGASELVVPNIFSSGAPAIAADVNANFNAAAVSVNNNDSRITLNETRIAEILTELESLKTENRNLLSLINTMQSTELAAIKVNVGTLQKNVGTLQKNVGTLQKNVGTLQKNVGTLQKEVVPELVNFVSVDFEGQQPTVTFSGVNLVVNNGEGETATKNGLGNLIVGYNENALDRDPVCSDGRFETREECEDNNQVFNVVHRDGSHNIVVGRDHHYSQYGGLVAGINNKITGPYATVTGGLRNLARGSQSSVSGGVLNTASGIFSSVTGGQKNIASGFVSSVTGGLDNFASGAGSSVTGGGQNSAESDVSSITGGQFNFVPTQAHYSSISGGANNSVAGQHSWRVSNILFGTDSPDEP